MLSVQQSCLCFAFAFIEKRMLLLRQVSVTCLEMNDCHSFTNKSTDTCLSSDSLFPMKAEAKQRQRYPNPNLKPTHNPNPILPVSRVADVAQQVCAQQLANAELLAQAHARKSDIKRRWYERHVKELQVPFASSCTRNP